MTTGYGRPILAGVVMAVIVLGGLAAWAFVGGSFGTPQDVNAIVVVLVTPDEEGVQLPQAMSFYELGTAGVDETPIDPDLEVTLAGSNYNKLRDAYPFGGGQLLVDTWAEAAGVDSPEWVVVDETTWYALAGEESIRIDMPADAEVFDGSMLYSFASGPASYSAQEVAALLKGVDYLETVDRADIRAQVSEELARLLSDHGDGVSLRTSLPDDLLATWMVRLGS